KNVSRRCLPAGTADRRVRSQRADLGSDNRTFVNGPSHGVAAFHGSMVELLLLLLPAAAAIALLSFLQLSAEANARLGRQFPGNYCPPLPCSWRHVGAGDEAGHAVIRSRAALRDGASPRAKFWHRWTQSLGRVWRVARTAAVRL